MAGNRNEGGRTRVVRFAEGAQLVLHLWLIAFLLTLIARALLS